MTSRVLRNIVFFPIVIVGLSTSLLSQQNQDDQELAKYLEKSVIVHAEVLKQSYCHVDDESFTASLDLKLRFTNSSGRSVILSRKIEPPSIIRVARNAEEANRNEFLYAPDVHFAVTNPLPDAPPFGEAPDSELFILLAPGENFETVVPAAVFGLNDATKVKEGNGLLAKGRYELQVGVYTWPYEWPYFAEKIGPQELKERWTKYGDLATGLVYSDFAAFTLPERFKNPRCSSKP